MTVDVNNLVHLLKEEQIELRNLGDHHSADVIERIRNCVGRADLYCVEPEDDYYRP